MDEKKSQNSIAESKNLVKIEGLLPATAMKLEKASQAVICYRSKSCDSLAEDDDDIEPVQESRRQRKRSYQYRDDNSTSRQRKRRRLNRSDRNRLKERKPRLMKHGKSTAEKTQPLVVLKEDRSGQLDSVKQFGKNFYCPSIKKRTGLRPIYIDGSNVAFSHGQHERFSVQGLKICIDYFRNRGHEVKAFVPHFRLRKGESTDQKLLHRLVTDKLVITTPTLYIQNQRRNPYDDWYIVQSAAANGGIIVSGDNYQDIVRCNPNLRTIVEESRLVPTFVDDMLIFPVDPHGNRQNDLEQFLKF